MVNDPYRAMELQPKQVRTLKWINIGNHIYIAEVPAGCFVRTGHDPTKTVPYHIIFVPNVKLDDVAPLHDL